MINDPRRNLIHDRGRGPELAGTRVIVFQVGEMRDAGFGVEQIGSTLEISAVQVAAALRYCDDNREEYGRALDLARSARSSDRDAGDVAAAIELLQVELQRRRAGSVVHGSANVSKDLAVGVGDDG